MNAADRVLARFVGQVDAEALGAHGVHVLVGDEEAQHRWLPEVRADVRSVSKGVCALAVGIAVDAGLVELGTTVPELLPDEARGRGADRVTLRHLLTMTSGIDFEWFAGDAAPWPDLAVEMLSRPKRAPDSVFQYSDASTYLAMRMLGAVVGDVRDWLQPRLFSPLGIEEPVWQRCAAGWIVGGSGLELRTGELARIGRLLLDRGAWRGDRLVEADWIDLLHGAWTTTGGPQPFTRYGLGVWDGPGRTWRLDGWGGQYVIVDEEKHAVVTITAHEEQRDHRLAEIAANTLRG